MNISKVNGDCVAKMVGQLSDLIDFKKDLPSNVFVGDEFIFWFFERPLISFVDLLSGLVRESVAAFGSGVLIKFSGNQALVDSCFLLGGDDIENGVSFVVDGFSNFFGGRVGYPIVLSNEACDWIAFESAHEELGVLGVRASRIQGDFIDYLDASFISSDALIKIASGVGVDNITARAFLSSYMNVSS